MVGTMNGKNIVGQDVLLRISDPAELGLKFDFDFHGKTLEFLCQKEERDSLIVEVNPEMEDWWGNRSKYVIVDPRWGNQHIKDLFLVSEPLVVNFTGLKKWPFPSNEPAPKNIFGQPLSPDAMFRQNTFGIGFGTIRLASAKVSQ